MLVVHLLLAVTALPGPKPPAIRFSEDGTARYVKNGQFDKAAIEPALAVESDPQAVDSALDLSFVLLALNQCEAAESTARRVIAGDEQNHKAHYLLGLSLLAQRRYTRDAVHSLRFARARFPNSQVALAEVLLGLLPFGVPVLGHAELIECQRGKVVDRLRASGALGAFVQQESRRSPDKVQVAVSAPLLKGEHERGEASLGRQLFLRGLVGAEIATRLAEGEASVQQLAEPFDISGPAISRHLKVLEQAGLISRGRDAQFRPCRLERKKLEEIRDWTKRMRRFWDESFDRMDDYLEEIMEEKSR